jgi:hypothetical protein
MRLRQANKSRQPTPGVRPAASRVSVARRGCAHRYMSQVSFILLRSALVASIWLCAISCPGQAQETTTPRQSQTNAPTGTYATGSPVRLTLHLGTTGTYEVQCDLGTQHGTWEWDRKQREFRLKPTPGKFPFDLRRLRLDRDDPECLQWIPVPPVASGAGAIDYVRFKRQKS